MGYSIELDEETARLLEAEAARRNVEPHTLGREFVAERVRQLAPTPQSGNRSDRIEELHQALKELEAISVRAEARSLPDEALTREAIYADHD